LESRGILEATKERFPAHYHVALFPEAFSNYLLAIGGGRELPPIQVAGLSGPPVDSIAESAPSPRSVSAGNAPSTRTASRSAIYRVRRGETLSRIASRYGMSADSLRRANGLRSSRLISGQRLRIPSASSISSARAEAGQISVRWSGTKSAATRARTVRVGRGDTLSAIAERHGTTIASLRKANGLRGSTVRAGQLLKVPSSGSSSISASRSSRTSQTASASRTKHATKRVRVGRGETLWQIAQKNGVSVASLKKANGLRSATVKAGQLLSIPAR
jgi:LysM repeat protein